MKALAFDFNGTMYMDTDKHRQAWNLFFQKHIGRPLEEEEFLHYACGPAVENIMRHFFPQVTDAALITALAGEKEEIYRRLCREDVEGLRLIEGLPEALDRLQARGVPMVIATGAGRENMDFYFEAFHLERWFDWRHVIYDDGTLAGKPDPDVYLRACARLGVAPENCVVVEDSYAGFASANAAKVGAIIAITATNPAGALEKLPGVKAIIDDYRDFVSVFDSLA